jgi:hypothetical protein
VTRARHAWRQLSESAYSIAGLRASIVVLDLAELDIRGPDLLGVRPRPRQHLSVVFMIAPHFDISPNMLDTVHRAVKHIFDDRRNVKRL